ncbi:hypothetical protein [Woodsholea maritima]|uniref:hypothetical protein n=1 Tax=Woodsholea maritima TaxID=240237 RepID=UPI000380CE5A|nr:hypothetical protein [Woodsholea maritima]
MSDSLIEHCFDGQALKLVVRGQRTPSDALGTLAYFLRVYKAQPARRILFDPRKATYTANMNRYMFEAMAKLTELPPSRIAVIKSDHTLGLVNIALEIVNLSTPHKMRAFSDEEAARTWLLDDQRGLEDDAPAPPPAEPELVKSPRPDTYDDVFIID